MNKYGGMICLTTALSDYEVLRQSVESVYPKEIFIKVLYSHSAQFRRSIVSVLGVDVKTVNPIYIHKHIKYTRRFAHNMFMFLDKDYGILGYLKGNKWDENWASAEDYEKQKKGYYSRRVQKTRDALWARAFHILMFDASEIDKVEVKNFNTVRNKNLLELQRHRESEILKASLPNRIFTYKCNKYKRVDEEELMNMMSQVLFKASLNLSKTQAELEKDVFFSQKIKKYCNSYRFEKTALGLLECLLDEIKKYKYNHKEWRERGLYNKKEIERSYFRQKIKLIEIYNSFFQKG